MIGPKAAIEGRGLRHFILETHIHFTVSLRETSLARVF